MKIYSEITPLTQDEIFVVLDHENAAFDYPIHQHLEYELSLILHCSGRRIIGDSVESFEGADLVLIGPNVYHKWERLDGLDTPARVITIQFAGDFKENNLLLKNSFRPINFLLDQCSRGIEIFGSNREVISDKMKKLSSLSGFKASLEFLDILNVIAKSSDRRALASVGFNHETGHSFSQSINEVYKYLLENYHNVDLSIHEAAEIVNMTDSAFSHFFKKRTGKNFTQYIVELRIGRAAKLLLETYDNIAQICYSCGFNNVSNFNRLFKKNKGVTPREYRREFQSMSESDVTDKEEYQLNQL